MLSTLIGFEEPINFFIFSKRDRSEFLFLVGTKQIPGMQ